MVDSSLHRLVAFAETPRRFTVLARQREPRFF